MSDLAEQVGSEPCGDLEVQFYSDAAYTEPLETWIFTESVNTSSPSG